MISPQARVRDDHFGTSWNPTIMLFEIVFIARIMAFTLSLDFFWVFHDISLILFDETAWWTSVCGDGDGVSSPDDDYDVWMLW